MTPLSPRRLSGLALFVLTLVAASRAEAYPWMIRHNYTGCASCHGDPSGGGVLTPYGRAQDVLLVTSPYGKKEEEAGPEADFAYGLVRLPEWLMATVTYRGALLSAHAFPSGQSDFRYLNMLLDGRAQIKVGAFAAAASLGYGSSSLAQPAALVGSNPALLSRNHWVGFHLAEDSVLIRAGRMDLPFGLRNVEHTSWVRDRTRTDFNASQQHGVALFAGTDAFRAELMAIVGNFQVHPDAVRERGYSGYVELPIAKAVALGASSLLTRAEKDVDGSGPMLRQAHGLFGRWSPQRWLALLGEYDFLVKKRLGGGPSQLSSAALLQVDLEPTQGLHVTPSLELLQEGSLGTSGGAWLTFDWFFLPHADLRLDAIFRSMSASSGAPQQALTALAQLHLFL